MGQFCAMSDRNNFYVNNRLRLCMSRWQSSVRERRLTAATLGRDLHQEISTARSVHLLFSAQRTYDDRITWWGIRSCFAVWKNCTSEHVAALRETERTAAIARESCAESERSERERVQQEMRT